MSRLLTARRQSLLPQRYFVLWQTLNREKNPEWLHWVQQNPPPAAMNLRPGAIERCQQRWMQQLPNATYISPDAKTNLTPSSPSMVHLDWPTDSLGHQPVKYSIDASQWLRLCQEFQTLALANSQQNQTPTTVTIEWLNRIRCLDDHQQMVDRLAFLIVFHMMHVKWLHEPYHYIIASMAMFTQASSPLDDDRLYPRTPLVVEQLGETGTPLAPKLELKSIVN
jgi:hypothetical protein